METSHRELSRWERSLVHAAYAAGTLAILTGIALEAYDQNWLRVAAYTGVLFWWVSAMVVDPKALKEPVDN